MIIAITGHRPNKLNNEYDLKGPTSERIKWEIHKTLLLESPSKLISGGALGIDQLFIQIGIELGIKIDVYVPCKNQEKMWPQSSKNLYNSLINNNLCTKIMCQNTEYDSGCMERRNRMMVNAADKLIAVFDGSKGGTYNAVQYAKKIDKPIIYINV